MENQTEAQWDEHENEVIATSQAVRLTCALCAFSALFAIFLLFADKKSKAIRRTAIQSSGLAGTWLIFAVFCGIFIAVFGFIPILGTVVNFFLWLILCAGSFITLIVKIRLAYQSYQGLAYTIPVIGNSFRKFED